MAKLTEPQHTILRSMRNRGLQDSAGMLQGLFEQITDRPGDEQLIEKIGGMVKQYTDDTPVKSDPLLDVTTIPITAEGKAPFHLPNALGTVTGTVEDVPLEDVTLGDYVFPEAQHDVGIIPVNPSYEEVPYLAGYTKVDATAAEVDDSGPCGAPLYASHRRCIEPRGHDVGKHNFQPGSVSAPAGSCMIQPTPDMFCWDCRRCREALDSEKAARLHICPIDLVPLEFVIAMGRVLRDGVKGPRLVDDWKDIRNTTALTSKTVSLIRHVIREQFAAAACNCLILWWAKEESNK